MPGLWKNVRGHALFYFYESSPKVSPHPKAAILTVVQSFSDEKRLASLQRAGVEFFQLEG